MTRATRRMGLIVISRAALALASVRLSADDAKVSGDLQKLQGTWVRAGEDGPELKWVFKGETLDASVGDMDYKCKVVLDSKATPHPTIDLTVQEGPADAQGKVSKGIYKLTDKKLVLCVTHPGADTRPTKFESVDGESFVFEMKPEK